MSISDDFFDGKGNFVPMKLVEHITSDELANRLVTPKTEKGGDIMWHYKHELGIYKSDGIAYVKEEAKRALGKRSKTSYVNEVVFLAQIDTYIQPEEFVEDPNLIVVKNGVFHLDTRELTEHNHMDYAKAALPVTYDPEAKCPKIEQFLDEVLVPGWKDTIYEIIGYTMLKTYPIARIFIFSGAGGNGKSQLIAIIKNFLGAKNISSCTLQQLVDNTFAPAQLYGKLANLCADIPPTPIKYTGIIKTLTGGEDQITAHHKYFALFGFVNHAKLIFSANEVPPADDNTPAWLRRPIIITFPNTFPAGEPGTILDMGNKISTDEELSGLFNLALTGLQRLLKNGKFTNEESLARRAEIYIQESNPVLYFITQFVEEAPSMLERLEKGILYKNYVKLCHALGRRPIASNKFSAEIPRYLPYIDDGDFDKIVGKTKKGKPRTRKTRVWYGIRLRTEALTQALAELNTKYNHRYDSLDPLFVGKSPEVRDGEYRSDNHEKNSEELPENQLFTEAIRILKEAGGKMQQQALFQALIKLGYHATQSRESLYGDSRFVFMGMDVNLGVAEGEKGTNSETANGSLPEVQSEREEHLRNARISIQSYLSSHTWMTIRDIPEAIFSSLAREAGVKGMSLQLLRKELSVRTVSEEEAEK